MATAVPLCHNCQEETKYHCLSCPASVHVCNRKAEMHEPKITQKRDIRGHGWLGWRRERQNYQKLE